MSLRLNVALLLTPFFLLLLPHYALADLAARVAEDFRPLSGVVIMPVEGEYLIDLDAAKGVSEGDLLAAVKPGEKIVHPVTKEILGSLDEVKAVLQVTRVKSGYSYARPVGAAEEIGRGDAVRRFEKIPTVFRDADGNARGLYDELVAALPHLDWLGYAPVEPGIAPPPALLVFVARGGTLEVLGPQGKVLRNYPLSGGAPVTSVPAVPAPAGIASPGVAAPPPPAGTTPPSPIVRRDEESTPGIWLSPDMEGEITGIAVGDFDGDGRNEVAAAFPHRLEIGRLAGGRFESVARLDLGFGQKTLRVDSADLDRDGRPELYLTAASDGELRSLTVAVTNGTPAIRSKGHPWYFRMVRLPGEGDVLLAQRMGGLENDFGGEAFRIQLSGSELKEGPPVALPRGVDLYGMAVFQDDRGERLLADFDIFDRLQVYREDGELLWQSGDQYGGSETFIERRDPTKSPADGPVTRNAYLHPRIEIGPAGEILVPANEGQRTVARMREFKKSRLIAMSWNGHSLEEVWHSRPQEAYLADFAVSDIDNDGTAELVQALVFSRAGFLSKGRSAVGVFELQ